MASEEVHRRANEVPALRCRGQQSAREYRETAADAQRTPVLGLFLRRWISGSRFIIPPTPGLPHL